MDLVATVQEGRALEFGRGDDTLLNQVPPLLWARNKLLETGVSAWEGRADQAGLGNGAHQEEENEEMAAANGFAVRDDCGDAAENEISHAGESRWGHAKVGCVFTHSLVFDSGTIRSQGHSQSVPIVGLAC